MIKRLLFGFLCLVFMPLWEIVSAQQVIQHQKPTLIERNVSENLEFEIRGVQDSQVLEAILFIRPSGRMSYSQQEGRLEAGRVLFPVTITDPAVSEISYYFVLRLLDGSQIVYPDIHDNQPPLQVDVVEPEEEVLPVAEFVDYTILSPRPGQAVSDDDVLIAMALFYDQEDVSDGEFRINLNGVDVTDNAEISPFVIKHTPVEVDGPQQVQVTLELDNRIYEVANWSFRVIGSEPMILEDFGVADRRPPSGNAEFTARNQDVAGTVNDAISGRLRISGKEGGLTYSLSGFLTSQESFRFQPQNRYQVDLRYNEWLYVQGGDVFPYLSDLTISGRRVRGISTEINAADKFELQFVWGQMNRSITNEYSEVDVQYLAFNEIVVDTLYTLRFEDRGRGTFAQNLIGGRVAFGNRDRFQVGFSGMKIEDDTTSISVIDNYSDVLSINQNLASGLDPEHRNKLSENPNLLQVEGSNPRPRGNFVAGSDLAFSFDQQRIRFHSETGLSLLNQNIRGGPLDQNRADELGVDLSSTYENLLDQLSWLIIINDHMSTLPFRYRENDEGELEIEPFFPTGILANQSRLNLNYFDHQLQIRYQWVGPDYQSLANSTIRRDVAGFSISDRFRVMDNRLYITLGYENLRDNLLDNREATIRTTNYQGGLSWYPRDPNLPRISLNSRFRIRDNDVERYNPYVAGIDPSLERSAQRNFQISNGDTLTAPSPRFQETFTISGSATQNFELFDINHQFNLNLGLTQTNDQYFLYGDSQSKNISTRLTSRFEAGEAPIRTRIGYSLNLSESVNGLSEVTINGFDIGAETFLFDGRLSLSSDLAFTRNRFNSTPLIIDTNNNPEATRDNYFIPGDDRSRRHTNAFIFRMNAEYDFNNNHALRLYANLTNVRDPLGNLGSMPNDRILQLRYIFRF